MGRRSPVVMVPAWVCWMVVAGRISTCWVGALGEVGRLRWTGLFWALRALRAALGSSRLLEGFAAEDMIAVVYSVYSVTSAQLQFIPSGSKLGYSNYGSRDVGIYELAVVGQGGRRGWVVRDIR